jgi:hypothetical protein
LNSLPRSQRAILHFQGATQLSNRSSNFTSAERRRRLLFRHLDCFPFRRQSFAFLRRRTQVAPEEPSIATIAPLSWLLRAEAPRFSCFVFQRTLLSSHNLQSFIETHSMIG